MRIIKLGLAVILFLLLDVGVARACSCMPPPPAAQALTQSDAVFSGRVIKIKRVKSRNSQDEPLQEMEVVLEVNSSWKGAERKRVTVFTASQSAACGYSFRKGVTYLVYANDSQGKLVASICSRTKRLKDARDDLGELGSGKIMRKS